MNKKIIVSKGVFNSIEWLKNSKINIDEFLKMLDGTIKLKDLRDELQELMKLDNEIISKILFNGYEVEKEKLENLPLEFKFKHDNYSDVIHYCYKKTDHIIVSWINKKGNPEAYKFKIEECLSYINKGHWILID